MNKQQFIKKYLALNEQDKTMLKTFYNDLVKGAIFLDTFKQSEQRLQWIKEAEQC